MNEEPRYVADDDQDVEPPFVTKSGRVLTEADLDALVEEAERGYDVSRLLERAKRPTASEIPPRVAQSGDDPTSERSS